MVDRSPKPPKMMLTAGNLVELRLMVEIDPKNPGNRFWHGFGLWVINTSVGVWHVYNLNCRFWWFQESFPVYLDYGLIPTNYAS
jgi:hypothetical protein